MKEMILQGAYIAVSAIFLILLCEWTYHWMVSSKKKILIGRYIKKKKQDKINQSFHCDDSYYTQR